MIYYIVYDYKNKCSSGKGYSVIKRKKRINTLRDINELTRFIKEENNIEFVVITNWKRLKGV